jgi:HYR domain
MLHRPLRRAAALSLGALLAFAGTASADTLFADADAVTPVVDGSWHLGDVSPGGLASRDVRFLLVCAGVQHVDASQSVVLTANGGTVPLDGAIVSVSPVTFAPLTTAWGADGLGCPDPVPAQEGGSLSHVVLRAPTTAGTHTFTVAWIRSLEPVGSNDANAFSRTPTSVNFTLRVVANAAPTLTVPASFTVEGDTAGGWAADWSDVSATDPEDSPDPTPTCLPAAGTVLPVGTTTHVTCSVTDLAGASVSDGFDVTVEDTTAPVLSGVPGDITVTTSDPTGRIVTYTDPSATDVVDASPTVACTPASGDWFAVQTTTVTCTATDATGKSASATFDVTVDLVEQHAVSATWLEPVASSDATFTANPGRTLPIKVRLFLDGVEQATGNAELTLTPCGGGSAITLALDSGGGRWNHSLDTSMLSGACYEVGAAIDGLAAGSFRLELGGEESAKTASKPGGGRAR